MFLENTNITDKEVYEFLSDKGKDYEDTYAKMHDVYYLPNYDMPTDVNQILLPVGDVINFLKKEKSRETFERETIELDKKLERDLKWYNTQNAKDMFDSYPKTQRDSNRAYIISIINIVILSLTLIVMLIGVI